MHFSIIYIVCQYLTGSELKKFIVLTFSWRLCTCFFLSSCVWHLNYTNIASAKFRSASRMSKNTLAMHLLNGLKCELQRQENMKISIYCTESSRISHLDCFGIIFAMLKLTEVWVLTISPRIRPIMSYIYINHFVFLVTILNLCDISKSDDIRGSIP